MNPDSNTVNKAHKMSFVDTKRGDLMYAYTGMYVYNKWKKEEWQYPFAHPLTPPPPKKKGEN